MDEFLTAFDQHLETLLPQAFECMATGRHAWKRKKTCKALVNGKWTVFKVCECGTEVRITKKDNGKRRHDYDHPDGYPRERGSGPRTAEINALGYDRWLDTLRVVDF